MLAPQETQHGSLKKSTACLQSHPIRTQSYPKTQATQRQRQKGGMEFIPCCTAGVERLAEGLGDRSLQRTEQAAERAAEPGLAVDQQRGMWEGKRKGSYSKR